MFAQKGSPREATPKAGEAGFSPILLILLATLGIIIYLLISSSAPFKDKLFSFLYPKPSSQAAPSSESVPDEILIKFKAGVGEIAKDNIIKAHGLEIKETIPAIEVALAKVPEQAKDRLIEALNKNPNIEYVEPNYIVEAQLSPNDTYFPNQWALPKISAPTGWDISTGSPSTVIAILDSGIDLTHEDLSGKYLGSPAPDVCGHGTLVSGVAAAVTNNAKGIASVCWQCMILSIKVLNDTCSGSDYSVGQGITAAADQGARVINLSLGSSASSSSMANAVNYAWNRGVVIVAASGNTPSPPIVMYPAAFDNVIAVGSINSNNVRVSDSNYGPWLDVVAPGYIVRTTQNGGSYTYASGTSLASPHVAGLVGLILSVKPGLSNAQVVDIITSTADDLGPLGRDDEYGYGRINVLKALQKAANTQLPPPDTTPPSVSITYPSDGATLSGYTVPLVSASASDNVFVSEVKFTLGTLSITDKTSPYEVVFDTTKLPNGTTLLKVEAKDTSNNASTAQITVNIQNKIVDTTAPTISVISPTDGSTVSGITTISASASDNVSVASASFFIDGIFLGEDTSSPYEISWDSTKETNGNHTIQAKALDTSNNLGESTIITVNVNNTIATPTPNPNPSDTTPPTVSITQPLDGSIVPRNTQVTIQVSASDNVAVSKVEFLVNNSIKCTSTVTPYTCNWKVPGKRGASYTIQAKAYDTSNNTNSSTITVRTQ